jgi:hypothetical protein
MSIKLPFGFKGEILVHISEAERGLACGCICPSCESPLIARKGSVTAHHFSHYNGAECSHAVETALHLASKQILIDCLEITLPAVQINFDCHPDPIPISAARTFRLSEVRAEHRTEDIVPDIVAYSDGHPLMIEIRVTHGVDEIKRDKIRRLGISTIEIDLSSVCRTFSRDELLAAVVHGTANKEWIFNAKAERYKRMLLETGERKKSVRRGLALHVDDCPINIRKWRGKSYANVLDDCSCCPFLLGVGDNNDVIDCGGRHQITTLDELLTFYKRKR